MMAPLSSGVVKVVFLHVLQPKICLQREEQVRAQRRAEELDKQKKRVRKPKQPMPRRRFVCLFASFLCIDGTTMMQ